jgi:hypothetical protein
VCDGVDACDTGTPGRSTVLRYACSLVCDGGTDACGDLDLNCGDGPCQIECGATGRPCQRTTVHCGAGACTALCEGTSTPTVHCQDSCDCTEC